MHLTFNRMFHFQFSVKGLLLHVISKKPIPTLTTNRSRSGWAAISGLLMWHSIVSQHWLWNGGREAQQAWKRSSPVAALYALACSSFSVDSSCILMRPRWQQSVRNTHKHTLHWPFKQGCGQASDRDQVKTKVRESPWLSCDCTACA